MAKPKARTFPSVLAGILLLLIPIAYIAAQVLGMADVQAKLTLSIVLKELFTEVPLTDVAIYYVLPIIGAIVAFTRKKGLVFLIALLFAAAWGYATYLAVAPDPTGAALAGEGAQATGAKGLTIAAGILPGLWTLAWFIFAIVALVGWVSGKKVKFWPAPFVLALVCVAVLFIMWLKAAGAFQLDASVIDSLNAPEKVDLYVKLSAMVELGIAAAFALVLLFWGMAVGMKPHERKNVMEVDQLPVTGTVPAKKPAAAAAVTGSSVAAAAEAMQGAVTRRELVTADEPAATSHKAPAPAKAAPAPTAPESIEAAKAEIDALAQQVPSDFAAAEAELTAMMERQLNDIRNGGGAE